MALAFNDNINYTGDSPNFERDQFATIAEMAKYSENYLPDTFIATCVEDGKIYLFNKNIDKHPKTGKWRAVGSANLETDLVASIKVGGIKENTTYVAGVSLESIITELLGGEAPTVKALYYGVSDERNISSVDSLTAASIYKEVKTSFAADNQYLIIAVPDDIDAPIIYDANGMNNTSCFETYPLDGYVVYVSENKITCENFEYKIAF